MYSEEHEAYIREHGDIQPDEDYEMDLSVSDRKVFWALSGNECAICNCKLVRKKDSNTNVGEECHISSEKPDWPSKEFSRYEPSLEEDKRNKSVDNAILLCANCHKIIDNPEKTQYTIEALHEIKEKHEEDIAKGRTKEIYKEKTEHEKIEKNKLIHSKELSPYFEALIKYGLNIDVFITPPKLDTKFPDEIFSHIKYYKDIQQYLENRDSAIKKFNNGVKNLLKSVMEQTRSKINKKIPSMVVWDGRGEPKPIPYYRPEMHYLNVQNIIKTAYDNVFEVDFSIVSNKNSDKNTSVVSGSYCFAESDSKSEIEQVKNIAKSILKDALTGKDFNKIKEYYKGAKDNHELFVKGIKEILESIKYDNPVEGKCRIGIKNKFE
ncbi:MAG: HNH endonuclease [Candidatus Methanoperedens sp.]